MERLAWFVGSASLLKWLAIIAAPFLVNFVLYLWNQPWLLLSFLYRKGVRRDEVPRLPDGEAPDALFVIPTLLRKRGELESLKRGAMVAARNGYSGRLIVVLAVDDVAGAGERYEELERWAADVALPPRVRLFVTGTPRRTGKGVAIDHAIRFTEELVARGDLDAFPPVFLNMDADSQLSEHAVERLVVRLHRPLRWTGERPLIVAANVCVREDHYWQGWRRFFSLPGQLVIAVAREYKTSIGLGKHNSRPIPTTGVSGALYATWSEVQRIGPRYATFLRTLRYRDLARWWLGGGAPKLSESDVVPVPESMTGPGDDTWATWIAWSARWRDGRLDFDFPETPWRALVHAVKSYVVRPIAYDPLAKVFTASPDRVRPLFKQRVRWNCSRIWILQRYGLGLAFQWAVGSAVLMDVIIVLAAHAGIALGLVLFPFLRAPAHWIVLFVVVTLFSHGMRGLSTALALLLEGRLRAEWRLLLALPVSGVYHFAFNIVATLWGLTQDLFLFGLNTHFAPEETLVRTRVGRVALAYRLRRAVRLSVRALRHGDVPLGWFWLGWDETPWTRNGYEGWTSPPPPRAVPARAPAATRPLRARQPTARVDAACIDASSG